MRLSTALRTWLAASHDALSQQDRTIATDLAAEIENGEFAQLTTDLTIEQQVTVVAMTAVADPERVGHVFRSALHWHATGGAEAAGVTAPPIPGALPPAVTAPPGSPPGAMPDQTEASAAGAKPKHQRVTPGPAAAPSPTQRAQASSPAPSPPVQAPPAPQRSPVPVTRPPGGNAGAAGLAGAALLLALVLAAIAVAMASSQRAGEVNVPPNFTPAPTPTPTTNPAVGVSTEPAPTPTPTTNPALRVDAQPTPTTSPASRVGDGDGTLWGTPVLLYALEPAPTWRPIWTLEVSPGRIIDPAERGEIPAGYQVIAFDVTVLRLDGDDAAAEPPLAFPRLIFFGGASQLPNLGGGNFTCPTDAPWPQFASEVNDFASGTMCFIETEADLASDTSVLIFESDGHAAVVFPIN